MKLYFDIESLVCQSPFEKKKQKHLESVMSLNVETKEINNLPYKIFAVTAKRRLFEKPSHEFVIFDVVHILLTQRSTSVEFDLSSFI